MSMVRKVKELQTPEKSGRVLAEQLVKQRSAQMIWNRGVVGRGVSSNHEPQRWKLQTAFSPKLQSKVLSGWQDSLIHEECRRELLFSSNPHHLCFYEDII